MSSSSQQSIEITEESLQEARRFVNRKVTISSRCGRGDSMPISVPLIKSGQDVTTSKHSNCKKYSVFIVEPTSIPGVVAFRLDTTDLYLTNVVYGDEQRQEAANALATVSQLLPDHLGTIVDYAIGRPTDEQNFEGAGFNYSPMQLQSGPPNMLQKFVIEATPLGGHGIRSLFGTYWRSQWWNNTVSQSPHLMGDEEWRIREVSAVPTTLAPRKNDI